MAESQPDELASLLWQEMLIDWVYFSEIVERVRAVPASDANQARLEQEVGRVFRELLGKGATAWITSSEQPHLVPFPAAEAWQAWSLALASWKLIQKELCPGDVCVLRRVSPQSGTGREGTGS